MRQQDTGRSRVNVAEDNLDLPDFTHGSSYFENCNQIFLKGPALTMEILEKMNSELVPKKTNLFGYELNTKRVLFIGGLSLFSVLSIMGFTVMWFTDVFDKFVLSQMVIANNSDNYYMWRKPSPTPFTKVYIFNYTNVEDYKDKFVKKLHVEEVGPYVYQEHVERVNIKFSDDGDTVTYQEKREFTFRPDLSKGKQSDQITVPNIPLLAGSAISKHQNFWARMAFGGILSGLSAEPFIKLAAESFIMGYDDNLYELSKTLSTFSNVALPDKFGLFSSKIGISPFVFKINTGKNDINNIGIIEEINGEKQFNFYSTQECNSFKATDGALYPPRFVQEKQMVKYLLPQMCRTIPLFFEKETNILDGKVPAYEYTIPADIFDSADEKPENQCYCDLHSGQCPLKGVFNITSCTFGTPMFVSRPHFKNADPTFQQEISGLKPNAREYPVSVNIHPMFGFVMSGKMSLQMNIQVLKADSVSQVDMFDDGMMLPIAWFDISLDEKYLPNDFLNIIYQVTFTYKGVKLAFKYGSLLTTLMTLICIVLIFRRWYQNSNRIRANSNVQDFNVDTA